MTDEELIKQLKDKKKIIWKKTNEEILNYLENRYSGEFHKYSETYYRILNNINEIPKCPECGKPVRFIAFQRGYSKHCSHSCALNDKTVQNKLKQTVLEKYGVDNVFKLDRVIKAAHSPEAFNKQRLTSLLNCGYTHFMKSPEKLKEYQDNLEKKRGVRNVFQLNSVKEKCKETWKENYGVDHPMKSDEVKEHLKEQMLLKYNVINAFNREEVKAHAASKETQLKIHESKKKNNSYGRSKLEIEMFNLIKQKFPDTVFQYVDKLRYPFPCDFYIPSKDIFIECQGTWQHGKHPFNENNPKDIELVNKWKSRIKFENGRDQYYNAYKIFTYRDPHKRNVAKQNNINLIEFWNIDDCKEWLKKMEE